MSQTSSRVGWNGGLGWWAERQCREDIDFALYYSFGAIRGVPLLRLTAVFKSKRQDPVLLTPFFRELRI
ncbi:MAG: hypothetical protein NTX45_22060 [Proteobacteria bacterium]|nr:hypothetical protein [Pseudomonadota bacterium]